MRAVVAMSGGVDSSVAAALMVEAGHQVIGVTLKLWAGPNGEMPTAGCCTVGDAEDARRVAAQLDIPYYVLDYTDDFEAGVIDGFVSDYRSGRTPNPCVECNRTVKFSRLLAQSADFDCDMVVTGHYARVDRVDGRYRLRRGVDRAKDQSYVLSMLTQDELARVAFPVGDLEKRQVREIASRLGLRTAHKPDSMDICFVGRRDYRSFLRSRAPDAVEPGDVVTTDGEKVGRHTGVAGFTVGQRRGLGVALGEPRYVVAVDAPTRTVTIGSRSELECVSVEVTRLTWTDLPLPAGSEAEAQYRAHGEPATATWDGDRRLEFDRPQPAVAPGQTVAFYQGATVLGGAVIDRAHPPAGAAT